MHPSNTSSVKLLLWLRLMETLLLDMLYSEKKLELLIRALLAL